MNLDYEKEEFKLNDKIKKVVTFFIICVCLHLLCLLFYLRAIVVEFGNYSVDGATDYEISDLTNYITWYFHYNWVKFANLHK